jgi:hypothetical protein
LPRKRATPEDRLTELAKVRKKARRSFKEVNRKKNSTRSAGELIHKQNMTVILSVAGYTNSQIAATLGESRGTIAEWKKDPAWNEEYHKVVNTLTDSAKTLLQTYTIEAVHELVRIMRTSEDDAIVMKAVGEIFDRGGMPKTSRRENDNSDSLKFDDDGLVEKLRKATPEVQEQAAVLVEGLEKLLSGETVPKAEGSENGNSENDPS